MVQPKKKKKQKKSKKTLVAVVIDAPKKRLNQKECRAIQKKAFLEVFENNPSFTKAAEIAHVDRKSIYLWRQTDKEFADAIEKIKPNARINYLETLEEEARRRGVDGVEEAVYYKGEVCGYVRKYSDTMLAMLLNGASEKYHRARVEVTGTGERGELVVKVIYDPYVRKDDTHTGTTP